MAKNEKTSEKVATEASKVLRDPKSTKIDKSVAGSALTQAPDKKKKNKKDDWDKKNKKNKKDKKDKKKKKNKKK
jgi:hypothetical protein